MAAAGLSRRDLLERGAVFAAGISVSVPLLAACGPDPVYPIAWQPDALRPVFYGWQDIAAADGAPANLRVWYPSLEGSPENAPILSPSRGRFPLVLFLHGQCPQEAANHYRTAWFVLPAELARSGYVVAVPQLGHASYPWESTEATLAADVAGWMRSGWAYRDQLMPSPGTAVVGHSYGGMLAARLAVSGSDVPAAYVSIGTPWSDWSVAVPPRPLAQLRQPALFMWGGADALADAASLVNTVPMPRHTIMFSGATHWDHARTSASTTFGCDQVGPGPCRQVAALTADYTALFLTKYLRPDGASTDPVIGEDLRLPPVQLTDDQHFYAGGHLTGLQALAATPDPACSGTHSWSTTSGSGQRPL
jgi:pimeloyl-ACP methyl ester carboxylesterase